MKTYIVILLNDGVDRERGTIIHMTECGDTQVPKLGREIHPPTFGVIELLNTAIKDLPATFREYGEHKSRMLLNWGSLTGGTATNLGTKPKVEMTSLQAKALFADRGTGWLPESARP